MAVAREVRKVLVDAKPGSWTQCLTGIQEGHE
jgi:hypothetical protein